MNQGELWNADLNPVRGSEQAGYRPVMVVSGNVLNHYMNIVIVMPLTTRIKNYKGHPILAPDKNNGLKERSEVLVFHVRSVSKDRLVKKLGKVTSYELKLAKKTLNQILTY